MWEYGFLSNNNPILFVPHYLPRTAPLSISYLWLDRPSVIPELPVAPIIFQSPPRHRCSPTPHLCLHDVEMRRLGRSLSTIHRCEISSERVVRVLMCETYRFESRLLSGTPSALMWKSAWRASFQLRGTCTDVALLRALVTDTSCE